ncbi:glutamate receptor 2-like [Penaeus vannamei]|uniref:glutamate receptor 2-like n=1 Tax=Penaeus vannamei TaxID=6689 RepID=UPI00387F6281
MWFVMSVGLVFVSQPTPELTVTNYLFSFAGSIAQQGCEVTPICLRGRCVFISFWVGALLVYVSYTARLTSQLAVTHSQHPFTSLVDALSTAGYSVFTVKGTSYLTEMETARDEGLRLAYRQLIEKPEQLIVDSVEEGVKALHTSQKALFFHDEKTVNYAVKGSCNYTWVGRNYFTEYVYLGYRKNLSFAGVLSHYLSRAEDYGISAKLKRRWRRPLGNCGSDVTEFQELGIAKTASAFVFLALGSGLSFVLLFAAEITKAEWTFVAAWDATAACNSHGI